jgi:membrane fusion protein, heavy metal efflux system
MRMGWKGALRLRARDARATLGANGVIAAMAVAVAVAGLACSKGPAPQPGPLPAGRGEGVPGAQGGTSGAAAGAGVRAAQGSTTSSAAAASAPTPWVKARNAEELALLEAPALVLATPESNAGVSPPFRARIVRVSVRPGDTVERGQPVAVVVMPEVVQAAGAYASAATRVEAYGRRKAQLDELKKEGMVRLTELLESETRLAEARADQQGALALLRAGGLGPEDAQRILAGGGEVALRSPIAGVVTQVRAAIGEQREAAGEPMVRIAGEGEPRVEARVARMLPRHAEYELWLPTGERHALRPVGRAPQVDARDGTTLVWLEPLRKGTRLVQGQTGKVKARLEEEEKAVAVPARAVGLAAEGPYVVAHRGGKGERVRVEVIAASGSDALVRGAVAIGDEIAAEAELAEAGGAPVVKHEDQDAELKKAAQGGAR